MRFLKKHLFVVVLFLQDKYLFIIEARKKNRTALFNFKLENLKPKMSDFLQILYLIYKGLGRKIRH